MGQIFHPSTNTISKVSIFGFVFIVGIMITVIALFFRSSYSTQVNVALEQPVAFSHEHHVTGLGVDCRYCHVSVEDSSFAGLPPSETCMTCHSQVWADAPMLEPVRVSYQTGQPLEWNRVHNLADFAYFNHSIHIEKGVGCESCHGRVDQMPLMWKAESLQMEWCLRCHRAPEEHLRPREEVFTMGWEPSEPQEVIGRALLEEHHIQVDRLTDCSICHR